MSGRTPLRSSDSSLDAPFTTPRALTSSYGAQSTWGTRTYASTTPGRTMEPKQSSPEHTRQFQTQIEDEIRQLAEDIDSAEEAQNIQFETINKRLKAATDILKQEKSMFLLNYLFKSLC